MDWIRSPESIHGEAALTTGVDAGTLIAQLCTPEICVFGRCEPITVRPFHSIDIWRRCMDVMRTLTVKYADGYEGWAKQKGEEPVIK